MPILIFMLLGFGELARAFAESHTWQRSADVLADSAAIRMASDPGESWKAGWNQLVNDEQDRTGCGEPEVTFPDAASNPGDRVQVSWTCQYTALLFNGLSFPPKLIESVAVIPLEP